MLARTLALALAAGVLGAAAPADALAHNVSRPSPRHGDGGTVFSFKGRAWQPFGRVTARYFRSDLDQRPFRAFRFQASGNGKFKFRLSHPWFWEEGAIQRICFVQFDTRFGRKFRKCQRFYVDAPSAYFTPADGVAGQLFFLVARGFEPGVPLTVELLRPDGVLETYGTTTRRQSAFVTGGVFGPILVPRGGAVLRFQSNPTDPLGLYTAFVFEPGAEARARTAVFVRPPG